MTDTTPTVASLLDEKTVRRIITSFFDVNTFVDFQLDSFDEFMSTMLPYMVEEQSVSYVSSVSKRQHHTIKLLCTTLGFPNHKEKDGTLHSILPAECRVRSLTYSAPVFCDILHTVRRVPESIATDPLYSGPDALPGALDRVEGHEAWPVVKREKSRGIPIVIMPVMVGSANCNMRRQTWTRHECPYDKGGYFIVRGSEKILQPQGGLRTNCTFLFRNKKPAFEFTCEVRSLHESKYRSTSTLNVRITSKKRGIKSRSTTVFPHIAISIPFLKPNVELMKVFRMLRVDSVDDMVLLVFPETAGDIDAPLASLGGRGDESKVPPGESKVPSGEPNAAPRDRWGEHSEDRLSRRRTQIKLLRDMLDGCVGGKVALEELCSSDADDACATACDKRLMTNEFLPHLGMEDDPVVWRKKAMFLGSMVRRLLDAHVRAPWVVFDNRDSFANKRIHAAGMMMATHFRKLFRIFIGSLRSTVLTRVEAGNDVKMVACVNHSKITASIRRAFSTGDWNMQRQNGTHVSITQLLNSMNTLAMMSHIRRVNTPMCREGKTTKIRQLDTSHWGLLCCSATPEGASCGLINTLAITAHVRIGTPSARVVAALVGTYGVTPFTVETARAHIVAQRGTSDIHSPRMHTPSAMHTGMVPEVVPGLVRAVSTHVCVNGEVVGFTESPTELLRALRNGRRDGLLPYDISISKGTYPDSVRLCCDTGCALRPVLVVERLDRLAAVLDDREADMYGGGECSLWRRLLGAGVMEYLDKSEEAEMVVLVRPGDLARVPQATHLELHGLSILGLATGIIPFPDHNQAPRNMYQASMVKQAITVPSMTTATRTNTHYVVPYYCQRPVVQTWLDTLSSVDDSPMGLNAVVGIMSHEGYNQEDSVIMNKGAIDRGMFRSTYFSAYRDYERAIGGDKECFEHPFDHDAVLGVKHADYSKLDKEGTIEVGVRVARGDVLIGKTMTVERPETGAPTKRDKSTVYTSSRGALSVVDRITHSTDRTGMRSKCVVVRTPRIPMVGDKFSSRHGQKGTIGILLPEEDMPFSMRSGMVPSILMNPNALPSRMTIGQLKECLLGKLGCVLGRFGDGTAFRHTSRESISDALSAAGYERHGNETMVCGKTGRVFEAQVFMGPVFYQRLLHMVEDKQHARSRGPMQVTTRQPVEGRARRGGLRFGEMERDCVLGHGGAGVLYDRLCVASDFFVVPICQHCGQIADNKHDDVFASDGSRPTGAYSAQKSKPPYCRACDRTDVLMVQTPYSYKLLTQELNTIGIYVRHEVEEL